MSESLRLPLDLNLSLNLSLNLNLNPPFDSSDESLLDKKLDSTAPAAHHHASRRRRGMERRHALFLAVVGMVGLFWFYGLSMSVGTPPVVQLLWLNPKPTAFMLRDGDPLLKSRWRPLSQISPHLQHAVVAAEDDLFFSHPGYDLKAIKAAAKIDWKKKRYARGASTITMQVARNLYLTPRKSILRKLREFLIALKLERILTKQRILEIYLNTAEWGKGIYGADAAALHYFKKDAKSLTRHEAALLAAMLPRPRFYDQHRGSSTLQRRAAIIASRI
jgi:monofunctional glycosyltransferase